MRIKSLTRAAAVLFCLGLVAIGGWLLLQSQAQQPMRAPAVADKPLTAFSLTAGKHYYVAWTGVIESEILVLKTYSNGWIDAEMGGFTESINLTQVSMIREKKGIGKD
jgi:hypothetical protein